MTTQKTGSICMRVKLGSIPWKNVDNTILNYKEKEQRLLFITNWLCPFLSSKGIASYRIVMLLQGGEGKIRKFP